MFFSLYRGAWWKDSDNGSQTGGGAGGAVIQVKTILIW